MGILRERGIDLPEPMGQTAYRLGREPWGSMYIDSHGAHWRGIAEFLQENTSVWREALTTM